MYAGRTHYVSRPAMQYRQLPQALPSQGSATRAPTLGVRTPSPTAITVPTPSWPGISGNFGLTGQSPCAAWISVWHNPLASIFTSTCPAPGSGTSRFLISSGALNAGTTAAFMTNSSSQRARQPARYAVWCALAGVESPCPDGPRRSRSVQVDRGDPVLLQPGDAAIGRSEHADAVVGDGHRMLHVRG